MTSNARKVAVITSGDTGWDCALRFAGDHYKILVYDPPDEIRKKIQLEHPMD